VSRTFFTIFGRGFMALFLLLTFTKNLDVKFRQETMFDLVSEGR